MGLALPRSYVEQELNAMLEAQTDAAIAEAAHWNDELKRIDPDLSLVWVGEADMPSIVPNRFHIRKRVPGGLDGYIPLTGPNGEFREPGSWMLDALHQADMWNQSVRGERARNERKIEEAKRRERVREDEQAEDEMSLATRAARRIRGDAGMHKRTDLKDHAHILAEKARKKLILP